MKRPASLLPLAVAAIFTFISAQACGPNFSDDVFVREVNADHFNDFIAGKLGVLLPTYDRAELVIAYRYLNGGTLSPEEQKARQPAKPENEQESGIQTGPGSDRTNPTYFNGPAGPADVWLEARGKFAPSHPEVHAVKQFNVVYRAGFFLAGEYENCHADAFRMAVATLEARAKTWGPRSPELADWIKGQDAVFSNCGGTGEAYFSPEAAKPVIHPVQPNDAPGSAPLLLQQDRDYQKAAAKFYADQFAESRAAFKAIAQDSSSPWHGLARYLVARTLIRQSFFAANKSDGHGAVADFDPNLMKEAQHELESMRNEKLPGISSRAVDAMLNLVRLRTEPAARLSEISKALTGPGADPNYDQDFDDLTWLLNHKLDAIAIRADFGREESARPPASEFEQAYSDSVQLSSTVPLIDWLITFQSPSDAAKKHAMAEWKHNRDSVPWMLAALEKSSPEDAEVPALLQASARILPDSSGWPTIAYHRARLLIELGRPAEARRELEAGFPRIQAIGSESALNLFTSLRMRTAPTLETALADAPRRILERNSQQQYSLDECLQVMQDPKRKYDCRDAKSPVEFSSDAATLFNRELPLDMLALAAQSKALPAPLSQSVAITAWVRAVLLKNDQVAAELLPSLPRKLQEQAGTGTGFRPHMALLRNPGLRPFLDAGVQRAASYDFVESYADNWWCREWNTEYNPSPVHETAYTFAFLNPALRNAGKKESAALLALGSGEEYLGAEVLDYAKAHPGDPDIPEALYLTLRMIRYGCYHASSDESYRQNDRVPSIAREVGALMRSRYPKNPWTRKAAQYVWPSKKSG